MSVSTPRCASISCSAAGSNEIVAAAAGSKIKVLAYMLVVSNDVLVTWMSGSTAISGAMAFVANSGASAPPGAYICGEPPVHWLETASGEALNLSLSGGVQVSGHITYYLGS